MRLGEVKLEGDGGSIATLEFARGVFSTSSVAHDAYSVPSMRRRFGGDGSRLDISFAICLLYDFFRFLQDAIDGGGEGACGIQGNMGSWRASKDGESS